MTDDLFKDDCRGESRVVVRQSSIISLQSDSSSMYVKCFDPSGFVLHCHFEIIGDLVCIQAWG